MTSALPIPPALCAFLYGKRRHARHEAAAAAVVHGPSGPLPARVRDVSAGGMLLSLPIDGLPLPTDPCGSGGIRELERYFGGSCEIEVADWRLRSRARFVRFSWAPEGTERLYVGCCFPQPLAGEILERMGLPPEESSDEVRGVAPSAFLPLEARERVVLQIYAAGAQEAEPMCAGRLVALGDSALAARIDDANLLETMGRLGGRRLAIEVSDEHMELWTVAARLLAVRELDGPGQGVEIALVAEAPPAEMVTRHFEPQALHCYEA